MDSTVVIEPAYNALSDVRALFEAYTAMLVTHDPAFQIYLDIQHYADELRAPAAKYAPPDGRLYLARVDGRAAGCIALRRLDGSLPFGCHSWTKRRMRRAWRGIIPAAK